MTQGNRAHFDILDQLLLLLLGVLLLAGNLGWIDPAFVAYWPLILVIWAMKTIMNHR